MMAPGERVIFQGGGGGGGGQSGLSAPPPSGSAYELSDRLWRYSSKSWPIYKTSIL